jgi:hypothetical protein
MKRKRPTAPAVSAEPATPLQKATTPAGASTPEVTNRTPEAKPPVAAGQRATPIATGRSRRAVIEAAKARWRRKAPRPEQPQLQAEGLAQPQAEPEGRVAPNALGRFRRAVRERMGHRWQQAAQRRPQWAQSQPAEQPQQPRPETKAQRLAREKAEQEARHIPEPGPRIAPVLGDL